MKTQRGLGRGLGAILPVDEETIQQSHTVQEIPIDQIERNPYQPGLTLTRRSWRSLRSLSGSMG
jgi:hypothetical protein